MISAKSCGNPPAVTGAVYDNRVYSYPENVTYSCDTGYYETGGSSVLWCGVDGNYVGSQLVCQGR